MDDRSDQKHLVNFMKLGNSVREAGRATRYRFERLLGQIPAAHMRAVGRFDDIASQEARGPGSAGKSIVGVVELNLVR